MAGRKPPQVIIELMKKHEISRSDLWDCHGTWILTHKAVEVLGAGEGILTDIEMIHHDQPQKMVIIKGTARKGDYSYHSFGEAAPYNNKNAYPVAMAEKRALDRAILKALNLHGYVYSEMESDDFKKQKTSGRQVSSPSEMFGDDDD